MNTVVELGPWLLAGRQLVLKKWIPGLKLLKYSFDRIQVWAHLHNIPIEFWSEEGLSHLSSVVGKPLYAEAATDTSLKIIFAKICVEIRAD